MQQRLTECLMKVCQNKRQRIALMVGVSVILVMLLSLAFLPAKAKHAPAKRALKATVLPAQPAPPAVGQTLNGIELKLARIEQRLNQVTGNESSPSDQPWQAVQQQVSQGITASQQASQQQQNQLAQLHQQVAALQQSVALLTAKQHPHQQLTPDHLPFQVTAIDNIQESNVVTLRYDHQLLPLDVGDTLAGWTLLSANSTNQSAQFQRGESYVAIHLDQYPAKPSRSAS